MNSPLFSLLKIAVQDRFLTEEYDKLLRVDWQSVFDEARMQCVHGTCFKAILLLPDELRPPKSIFLRWYGSYFNIEEENKRINKDCVSVCEKFSRDGFECTILKGQGVGSLYKYPMSRVPGDIDIWVNGSLDSIIEYVKHTIPSVHLDISHKHIDFPIFTDTSVELHYVPSTLSCPRYNKSLQEFYKAESLEQFHNRIALSNDVGYITATTVRFNAVHILVHIFGHFFYEGIGLRQFMDYYFVLSQLQVKDYEKVIVLLKSIGLYRFTSATMFVLHEVFGLSSSKMIVPPNKRLGNILLDDVMVGGNFGQNNNFVKSKKYNSSLYRFIEHTKRQIRNFYFCPSEVIWSPWSRLRTYIWRQKNGYNL